MQQPRKGIAHKILAYLMRHPQAQDTAEGIAHWWLLEERIREGVREVRQELDELTAQGLVIESRQADATVRYRLNESKRDEIQRLLSEEN